MNKLRFAACGVIALSSACAPTPIRPISPDETAFSFVRPIFDDKSLDSAAEMRPAVKEIVADIGDLKKNGALIRASAYYRNLTTGRAFGVNAEELYIPASLMKVPLMLAYLKVSENQPEILQRRISYDPGTGGDENASAVFKPSHAIVKGVYSVDELLTYMIRYSDNNAKSLLYDGIDKAVLHSVLDEFGIGLPTDPKQDYVTVLEYSSVFRQLYNSSYLRRALSEKALKLMSESDFRLGLRAALPPAMIVAEKFGERHQDGIEQIHNCGIVYHPKHPYLLCILTTGTDVEGQLAFIVRTARRVNDVVDRGDVAR